MSTLSDVQALYSSVRGTWTKSRADIIAHAVLAVVVFWICGATIPRMSVWDIDPKQISNSEWFKLAKDTGIIYVAFVIPIVIVTVYAALLRTGGALLVFIVTLIVRPPQRSRSQYRLLTPSALEPLALTLQKSGSNALEHNTTGNGNTATGYAACDRNSTGSENTANGHLALYLNASGSNNLALGANAGMHVTTADNVICIGANVVGDDVSNSTWIGNVYGVTTQNGTTAPVVVSADGQLGTVASSERFKKDIATMDKASEAIMSLRPVTFHYKTDSKGTRQFGLIAEEVAKVNPALVLPDKEGKPYSVRYDQVNAMLLNEFLKEHKKTEKLEATVASLIATVKQQAAQIQKVSAQLEVSKPAPQMVNNP